MRLGVVDGTRTTGSVLGMRLSNENGRRVEGTIGVLAGRSDSPTAVEVPVDLLRDQRHLQSRGEACLSHRHDDTTVDPSQVSNYLPHQETWQHTSSSLCLTVLLLSAL